MLSESIKLWASIWKTLSLCSPLQSGRKLLEERLHPCLISHLADLPSHSGQEGRHSLKALIIHFFHKAPHGWGQCLHSSSILAWKIPGTGKPCGLPSMGSHRVGHDWSDLAVAAAYFALLSWDEVSSSLLIYQSSIIWLLHSKNYLKIVNGTLSWFSLGNCFIIKKKKIPSVISVRLWPAWEGEKILFASGKMSLKLKPFQLRVHWEIKLAFWLLLIYFTELCKFIAIGCRGPAPADPGSSKRGRRWWGSGYNSFN